LAEAKDTYLKAKSEYELRQDTRATLQNEEDYIINAGVNTGFQKEQTSSEINQSLVSQPVIQTVN
jgi:hypothetical protein